MNGHDSTEPTLESIDATVGPVLLEFGANWCPHCRATAPSIAALIDEYKVVRHIFVEDGPGRRLGRSFGVKLWPTLVFLVNGHVESIAVRPDYVMIREGFERITNPS